MSEETIKTGNNGKTVRIGKSGKTGIDSIEDI